MTGRTRLHSALTVLATVIAIALCGGKAVAQSLIPAATLGPIVPLDDKARILGVRDRIALTVNDISATGVRDVWIAAKEGVFRKKGLAWEHVPSGATQWNAVGFTAPKRIDVAPDGTVWVIGGDDALYRRAGEKWIRMKTAVADVGVGPTTAWLILKDAPQHPGTWLARTNGDGLDFFDWNNLSKTYGQPVALDVDGDDVPHIVTATGRMVKFDRRDPGQPLREETVTCNVESPDCDPGRVFVDVSAGGGALWITGRGTKDGSFTYHYSRGRFSGERSFLPLAPGMRAVASDAIGNLFAVDATGKPQFAEFTYVYQDSSLLTGAALDRVFNAADPSNMTRFDAGTRGPVVRLGTADGYTFGTKVDLSRELTISFTLHPLEKAAVTEAPQCILGYRSLQVEYFSICLDGRHETMAITVGDTVERFDVSMAPDAFDKRSGRHFVVRADNGIIEVKSETLALVTRNGTRDFEFERVDEAFVALGGPAPRPDGTGRLYFGSRDGRKDKLQAFLGTVRIWDRVLPFDDVFLNAQNGRAANVTLPGYQNMIVEAPFNAAKGLGAVALHAPVDIEGLWYPEANGTYHAPAVNVGAYGAGTFGIDKIEVIRIAYTPRPNPLQPQQIELYRDGEGGLFSTTFEQVDRTTFKGWQDPLTKRIGDDLAATPFDVAVLDSGRIEVRPPGGGRPYTLARVPAYGNDNLPDDTLPADTTNYLGYDVLSVSPNPTLQKPELKIFDSERRSTGRAAPADSDRKVPPGLIFRKIDMGEARAAVRFAETTRALQEDLRLGIGASIEVPEIMAFSRDVKFKQTIANMEKNSSMLSIGELWWAAHALVLDKSRMPLDPGFRAAVLDARDAMNGTGRNAERAARQKLETFIDNYGTHYANAVIYGSRGRFEKTVQETQLERSVERQIDIAAKNSSKVGTTPVKVSLDVEFGMGSKSEFAQATSDEDTVINTQGGSLSFATEEIVAGEDVRRSTPIALDLRPITELLSPIYFDDRDVFIRLRQALELAIAQYVTANAPPPDLSDRSFFPEVYMVTIDKLVVHQMGTGELSGSISMRHAKDGLSAEAAAPRVIWDASGGINKPVDGDEIIVGKSGVLSIVPDGKGRGTIEISAELGSAGGGLQLSPTRTTISLGQIEVNTATAGSFTAVSASCQCVTACPPGYEDEAGTCLKSCPVVDGVAEGADGSFEERGSTCYGSYSTTFYAAWDGIDYCEEKNPTTGCEWVALEIYPKCRAGFKRHIFGTCVPVCSEFGLENWLDLPLTTCARPKAARSQTQRNPTNQCAAGSVPGNDCSRVEIYYSVMPVELVRSAAASGRQSALE